MVGSLIVFALLAQYPPDGPPRIPQTHVLWVERVPDAIVAEDPTQQIDVLYILSSDLTTSQTTADTKCAQYETLENQVLANDPANISRVHMVACKIITYTSVNGNADFTAINPGGSLGAQASAWRNQYAADVVQFYTRSSDLCGLGWQNAAVNGQQYGYSWVYDTCALGNFSSIHEMAHNLGLAHDLPNQNPPSYSYGSGFCDSAHGRKDPMVYPSPCGGSRVAYFGNPDISPFGYPFGDAICCNNARVWRQNAAAVAAFRSPTPPVCGTITLTPSTVPNGYTGRTYNKAIIASGGTVPYTLAVISGILPTGINFTNSTLLGIPTVAGVSNFTIRATDSLGCTGSTAYALTILQLPTAPTNLVAVP